MFSKLPISWIELARRTVNKIADDNCLDLAAGLAFYFFLALFPALLFIISLMAYLPLQSALAPMLNRLDQIAPPPVAAIIRQQIQNLSGSSSLLTIGILGAIWSSSAAMNAIINTLNTAHGIKQSRPWWKARLHAIALTWGLFIFLLAALAVILAGPQAAGWMGRSLHLGLAPIILWRIIHWPLAFIFAILAIDIVYRYGPDADFKWAWLTPGSLFAALLFICTSFGFRVYIINFGSYNATYGAIGSVIVLLLWFYFSGLSLLAGSELDSAIAEASKKNLK